MTRKNPSQLDTKKSRRRVGAETIRHHNQTICRESGKVRFRDKTQVHDALIGTRRARQRAEHAGIPTSRREQSWRPCSACGGFHLSVHPAPLGAAA